MLNTNHTFSVCTKTGKIKFTKIDAMILLANSSFVQKKFHFKHKRKELRYYKCKFCKCYHLTSDSSLHKSF